MAPRRGARVVKVDHVIDYNNLTVKEVLCPICRSILIEPVTLPCNHVFCSSCFQGTMENANLVCPLCRIRIGSWLRSSKKENKLINVDYWNAIKKLFPVQIKNKLDGIDDNLDYEAPRIRISVPGELKKEYETQIQKETEVIRKEREAEAKASEDLIKKIKEREEYQRTLEEERIRLDEAIAKKLADELNCMKNSAKVEDMSCSQSTSKLNNHTNHKKFGPLDRFLKCRDLKGSSDSSSVKHDQSKKFDFTKKEYTCRILCQDIANDKKSSLMNWNLTDRTGTVDVNLTNLNILNKKISHELERVMDVEGNSDSSDSIDSEYRYFKPVDYRRNPPCQKTIPIKVPTIRMNANPIKISAPKGQNNLHLKPGISAFARFITTLLEEKEVEIVKTGKNTRQGGTRRKSSSPEKRQPSVSVKSTSPEKKVPESRLKSISPEKSSEFSSAPKKDQNRFSKIEKINSPSKRKISVANCDEVGSPRKRNKPDPNSSFGRFLATPSSPFRGFCTDNNSKKTQVPKTPPRTTRSRIEQPKSPQKSVNEMDRVRKLQEKSDYEFARKLQNQFNNVSYSTRSTAVRKGIKVTRQTTLDNMLSKKSYKV